METHTTHLRKVGGSVMLALPPAYTTMMQLKPGSLVGITTDGTKLTIDPKPRVKYTLAELLAASDYSQPQPPDQREWVDAPTLGKELL
jgi:antitoxin ChpS